MTTTKIQRYIRQNQDEIRQDAAINNISFARAALVHYELTYGTIQSNVDRTLFLNIARSFS